MAKIKDITGKKFNLLTVVKLLPDRDKWGVS